MVVIVDEFGVAIVQIFVRQRGFCAVIFGYDFAGGLHYFEFALLHLRIGDALQTVKFVADDLGVFFVEDDVTFAVASAVIVYADESGFV